MVFLIIAAICLIALVIGTITDIKTREVPDWINYSLIAAGVGLNLIFSIVYWEWSFIANSLAGFLAFLILALAMFYAGQWGGGDSKLIMGLGALIGLDIFFKKFPFLISFLINMLVVGAAYGLAWSLFLAVKNRNKSLKEVKKIFAKKEVMLARRWLLMALLIAAIIVLLVKDAAVQWALAAIALLVLATFYLWVFIKAIEKVAMLKYVTPDKLTEGDWIARDIKFKGRKICGPKDLGIEKKQIRQLVELFDKGKIKKILIKEGIPFVPSFLVAFILTLVFGNLFFLFI